MIWFHTHDYEIINKQIIESPFDRAKKQGMTKVTNAYPDFYQQTHITDLKCSICKHHKRLVEKV